MTRRFCLRPVALRLHFAQDRQRRGIRDGASFNHVAAVLGEQRLEGQVPELVVRRDDQGGLAAQSPLSRLEQEVIKFASRIAEGEIAAGKLRAKAFGLLLQFSPFDGYREDLDLSFCLTNRLRNRK